MNKPVTINIKPRPSTNCNYKGQILSNGINHSIVVKQKVNNGIHSLTMMPIPAKFRFKFTKWLWFKWVKFKAFIGIIK